MKNKYLSNTSYFFVQTWGLIPIYIVLILNKQIESEETLLITLIGGIILFLINVILLLSGKCFNLMMSVTSLSILLFALSKFIFPDLTRTVSNTELLCVSLFFLLQIALQFKNSIKQIASQRRNADRRNISINNNVYEFFHIVPSISIITALYIAFLVVFNQFQKDASPETYNFVNNQLNLIFIILFFIYEFIRMKMIQRMLSNETWLPIINDDLNVIGYVEQKESYKMNDLYLHPHIRVMVMCNNRFYLQSHNEKDIISANYIDIPISQDMLYGEDICQSLNRALEEKFNCTDLNVRQLLNTRYHTNKVNRIVFLYMLNIPNEDDLKKYNLTKGKLWSIEQIKSNLGKGVFNSCFEQEFEFVESTILFVYNLSSISEPIEA